jgi:membrane protease subunit HflC
MMKLTIIVTVAIVSILAIVFLVLSLFIVDQTQYAIVLRFGQIRKVISEPGLYTRNAFRRQRRETEQTLLHIRHTR